jgi:hypothetical protein
MIPEILEGLCEKFKVKSSRMKKSREKSTYRFRDLARRGGLRLGHDNNEDFETTGISTRRYSSPSEVDATNLSGTYQLEIYFSYSRDEFKSFLNEIKEPGTLIDRLRQSVKDGKIKQGSGTRDSQLIIEFDEKEKEQVIEFMYGFILRAPEEIKVNPSALPEYLKSKKKKKVPEKEKVPEKKVPEPDHKEGPFREISLE